MISFARRISRTDMEIALWEICQLRKPPFIHLLLTADIVEFNDEIRLLPS